jgi:predicted regulator of Ras-like GTPase activity (Roadblock/LC7/MglB family)
VKAILIELTDRIAARGAIVVAPDGMVIESAAREGVDHDRLSALGAAILTGIQRSMTEAGLQGFTQAEIAAEQGKVILVEAGPVFLLVLLGARLEIGPGSIEIRSAANRLARAANLEPA